MNVFDINVANIRLNDKTFVEEIKRKQQLGPSAYRRPLSHKRSAVLHWFWLTARFRFSVEQLYHCEQIRHPLNAGTTAWTNLTSFCWSFIYILCEFWRAVVSFFFKNMKLGVFFILVWKWSLFSLLKANGKLILVFYFFNRLCIYGTREVLYHTAMKMISIENFKKST